MKNRLVALMLLSMACLAQAATPTHQYKLDGTLTDDLGGPALVADGGTLDATGYSFGANQGLTLPLDLGAAYTIDLRFHFDNVNSGWNKIVDYKTLTSDSGMYTLNGQWDYCCGGFGTGSFGSVSAGTDARLTLTRSAAGAVTLYVNGVFGASTGNDGGIGDFTGNSARFFIDDFATNQNEARSGRVDFIRVFDTVLDATEVAALGDNPSAVPEPTSAVLMALGLAAVARRARAARRSWR